MNMGIAKQSTIALEIDTCNHFNDCGSTDF